MTDEQGSCLAEKRLLRRRIIVNFFILSASLLLSAVIGEVVIRVILKDKMVLFPRYHTDATYGDFTIRSLRPDTTFWHTGIDGTWKFSTNAQGFRADHDFEYDKPRGTVRVVSLGDSNTQGFEVGQEHTYSAVLERRLNESGIDAEVFNMGVSGFSTAEELVLLENEAIRYSPDFVVLGFYANDFEDNLKAGIFSLEGDRIVIRKHQHTPGVQILNILNEFRVLRWLSENSYFYSLAANTIWNNAKKLLLTRSQSRLQTEMNIAGGAINDYQLALASQLIQRMYSVCQRHGIRFLILDIPQRTLSGNVISSMPREFLDTIQNSSDEIIYSDKFIANIQPLTAVHVPHGQRHISELTHELIGNEASTRILRMLELQR